MSDASAERQEYLEKRKKQREREEAARREKERLDDTWLEVLRVSLALALVIAAMFPVTKAAENFGGESFSLWGWMSIFSELDGDVEWDLPSFVFLFAIVYTLGTLVVALVSLGLRPSILQRKVCRIFAIVFGCFSGGQLIMMLVFGGAGAGYTDGASVLRNWLVCALLGAGLSAVYALRAATFDDR